MNTILRSYTAFLMYDAGQTLVCLHAEFTAEAIRRPFVLVERTEPIN